MSILYEYKGPGNLKDFAFLLGHSPEQWIFVHKAIVDVSSPVLHRIIRETESTQGNARLYEMENYKNLILKQFQQMIEVCIYLFC